MKMLLRLQFYYIGSSLLTANDSLLGHWNLNVTLYCIDIVKMQNYINVNKAKNNLF